MSAGPRQAALEAGRHAAIDCRDARLLRERSSMLFVFPRAKVIARVEPPGQLQEATHQVQSARFFARRGAPTMRLAGEGEQPYMHEQGVVTLWRQLDPVQETITPEVLGRALRALHELSAEPFGSRPPRLKPFASIRGYLARPGPGFDPSLLEALGARANAQEASWQANAHLDPLSARWLHGDVTTDNIIVTAEGPLFVDLELSGVGPTSWDLVPAAVATRRYGRPASDFEALILGYGADPRRWEGFARLCEIYELLVVSWALHCCHRSPEMHREAELRADGLLNASRALWTLL